VEARNLDLDGAPSTRANDKRPRVLLVDDDPMLLRGMARILLEDGYEVISSRDGEDALVHVAKGGLDVIITDVAMPKLGGVELLREVRQFDLDVPVILATGAPSIDSAAAAVEHGAFKYLMKPVSPAELRETTEKALKLHHLARLQREALQEAMPNGVPTNRESMERRFDLALETLWPAFQPIVRASDGSLFGYEALLRTDEPTLRSPVEMLELAERLSSLWQLGRVMRERAATRLLEAEGQPILFLNLHPHDLNDPLLLDDSAPHFELGSRVVLEVTERAPLDERGNVCARIAELREAGFKIAVDDLGAGYSGLTSFVQLEPEFVKLDMSLIRGVDRSLVKQRLIRSINNVCEDMGLSVVAEGIETEAERDAVSELGCTLLQGYLIGKPGRELR
jgi:EAL domain-containing protein (putative c-di-GMP-specific phosphodiesterase class I)